MGDKRAVFPVIETEVAPPTIHPAPLPADVAEAVLRLGYVEWGATMAQPDDAHAAEFRESLRKTRDGFRLEGPQELHGLYVLDTNIVLCHTGTSPNSPVHAKGIIKLTSDLGSGRYLIVMWITL